MIRKGFLLKMSNYKFWLECNNKQEVAFRLVNNFMISSLTLRDNFAAVTRHYSVNWKQTSIDYMTVIYACNIKDMDP